MKRFLRSALTAGSLSLAGLISTVPAAGLAEEQAITKPADRPKLDVVFVLDTTGSMGGLIEGAKAKIWSIASRMAAGKPTPIIRVGLVAYRDRGDEYVTKRFDLTSDLDTVYANLKLFQAGGGGDGPEHVGRGLGEAVKLMSWSDDKKTAKMIFLVGDAPAHDDYRDGWNLGEWSKKAISKGIVVNTIRCGSDPTTETAFREVARLADGSFISLEQSGGMVAVATPFDDELSTLNDELSRKTLVAGKEGSRREAEAKLGAMRDLAPAAKADRLSYNMRAAPSAPAGTASVAGNFGESVDLTAAPQQLSTFKETELPAQLRAVPAAERQAFLEKQAKEKQTLEKKIVETAKKREAWMAENAKSKTDSFDEQVMENVAKQASSVGVTY